MQKTLFSLIDKEYPAKHSFVDKILLNKRNFKHYILAEKNSNNQIFYKKNTSIYSILNKRFFLKRLANLFKIYFFIKKKTSKYKNKKTFFFVRNDPLYLLICNLLAKKNDKIIYMNSFPHENFFLLKGLIFKLIIYFISHKKISLIGVSYLGMKRLKKYFKNIDKELIIPLISNFKVKKLKIIKNNKRTFIYSGSFSTQRKLNYIIESLIDFIKQNSKKKIQIKFLFIGGAKKQINNIHQYFDKDKKILKKYFKFKEKINQSKLRQYYLNSHIGISLIPPNEIYKEACPSKFIEYLSFGLAIIANKEILFQKTIMKKNKIGKLVSWNKKEIIQAVDELCFSSKLIKFRGNSIKTNDKEFNPKHFNKMFDMLLN